MAVERKTFLWIGNDRAHRDRQVAAGTTSGSQFGATGIGAWNMSYGNAGQQNNWVGIGTDAITAEGSELHKKALDVFWNDKENWAERIEGISGDMGNSGDGWNPQQYYYIRAERIPHRGDHVVFEYVTGQTGNGLLRNLVGSANPTDIPGQALLGVMDNKAFNAPLSPCLFGGQSTSTDGLSGEGNIWVNASTSGSSAANRQGPLSSVKVRPSYFHHSYGVLEERSKFFGFADNIDQWGKGEQGHKFWGGRVSGNSSSIISGASFGNVSWHSGRTGINLKALDVELNSPYRMPRVAKPETLDSSGNRLFPDSIINSDDNGGRTITIAAVDPANKVSPRSTCKITHADSIVNMSVGTRSFILDSGNVLNLNMSDMYMPNATDDEKKEVAIFGAPEKVNGPSIRMFSWNGTVSNTLRCDPCWYTSQTDFVSSIGSPDIIFGPYYVTGIFSPRVTNPATVSVRPQFISKYNLNANDITFNDDDSGSDEPDETGEVIGGRFDTFRMKGTGNERFSANLIKFEEFNPRWDVITLEGSPSTRTGVRGFNNKLYVDAGCTITNLNVDAGYFGIGEGHRGGDTFDTQSEVGDVVVLNGYAEQKAYINGEHPTIAGFNAFYIGQDGVNATGQNFQMRSRHAEFDFGQGVFLRTGPESTGVTGAGFAFVQAPTSSFSKRP